MIALVNLIICLDILLNSKQHAGGEDNEAYKHSAHIGIAGRTDFLGGQLTDNRVVIKLLDSTPIIFPKAFMLNLE